MYQFIGWWHLRDTPSGPDPPTRAPWEADERYQSAGAAKGWRVAERRDREPRQRGLQLRGRATAEMGRPPLLGLAVQRRDKTHQDAPAAQVYLEVLENVRSATIKPIIAAKVKGGAQFFTDEYANIYHFTKADYDHRTVNYVVRARCSS